MALAAGGAEDGPETIVPGPEVRKVLARPEGFEPPTY